MMVIFNYSTVTFVVCSVTCVWNKKTTTLFQITSVIITTKTIPNNHRKWCWLQKLCWKSSIWWNTAASVTADRTPKASTNFFFRRIKKVIFYVGMLMLIQRIYFHFVEKFSTFHKQRLGKWVLMSHILNPIVIFLVILILCWKWSFWCRDNFDIWHVDAHY